MDAFSTYGTVVHIIDSRYRYIPVPVPVHRVCRSLYLRLQPALQITIKNVPTEIYSLPIPTSPRIDPSSRIRTDTSISDHMDTLTTSPTGLFVSTPCTFSERLFTFTTVKGIFFSGAFCAVFWLTEATAWNPTWPLLSPAMMKACTAISHAFFPIVFLSTQQLLPISIRSSGVTLSTLNTRLACCCPP
jgi:hypothetical protein